MNDNKHTMKCTKTTFTIINGSRIIVVEQLMKSKTIWVTINGQMMEYNLKHPTLIGNKMAIELANKTLTDLQIK